LLACVNKGGGHTELAHIFEYDAVVGGVGAFLEVRIHDVYVFVVHFDILQDHHDGGEGVVDAAYKAESILLFAKDAVGFCVLGACIFLWGLCTILERYS
jgi:hypothetical protein